MKFLVATDGSEQSGRALEHAIELATAADAAITLVYAADPAVRSAGGDDPVADIADAENRLVMEDEGDAADRGHEILEGAAERVADRGVEVDTALLEGDPKAVIPEYADEAGYDALIVGHRGLSERQERVLGSVAKAFVERATVPVTVVR